MDKNTTYRRKIYRLNCTQYSARRNILPIKQKHLKKCTRVPQDGISIKIGQKEHIFKPALQFDSPYSKTASCIGTFELLFADKENTILAGVKFVYCNGDTFISSNTSIIYFLKKAGYRSTTFCSNFLQAI